MSDLHTKVFAALQALPSPVDSDAILTAAQAIITDGRKFQQFSDWLDINGPDLMARLNGPITQDSPTAAVADLRTALMAATAAAPPDAKWLPEAQKALDRTGGKKDKKP